MVILTKEPFMTVLFFVFLHKKTTKTLGSLTRRFTENACFGT